MAVVTENKNMIYSAPMEMMTHFSAPSTWEGFPIDNIECVDRLTAVVRFTDLEGNMQHRIVYLDDLTEAQRREQELFRFVTDVEQELQY